MDDFVPVNLGGSSTICRKPQDVPALENIVGDDNSESGADDSVSDDGSDDMAVDEDTDNVSEDVGEPVQSAPTPTPMPAPVPEADPKPSEPMPSPGVSEESTMPSAEATPSGPCGVEGQPVCSGDQLKGECQ